jgi:hypothetical protein
MVSFAKTVAHQVGEVAMRIFGFVAAGLSIFAAGVGTAHGQDYCDQILQYGIWNTLDASDSTLGTRQVANWAWQREQSHGFRRIFLRAHRGQSLLRFRNERLQCWQ